MSTLPMQAAGGWDADVLLAKSQRYAEQLTNFAHDDWRFVLWSSLALELLARAALANIHPTLLADNKDWNNFVYALDMEPKKPKFVPRSIEISEVFSGLSDLIPEFTADLKSFSILHMSRRNEELHSGGLPLDNLPSSAWLPLYYRTSSVLLEFLHEDMQSFFGENQAQAASEMISASLDESAKALAKAIAEHKTKWDAEGAAEQGTLTAQATNWATKHNGHRVKCPACDNQAIVTGAPIAAPIRKIDDDEITEVQQFLPSRFECIACGLRISGLPQLSAASLGDAFKATSTYEAAEYYGSRDPYEGYEPDFNEQ